MTTTADDRVLFEADRNKRIATITLNNPKQRNSTTPRCASCSRATSTTSLRTTTSPWCCFEGPRNSTWQT